jgi:tRNA(fMet)-specific endonuclease VapC
MTATTTSGGKANVRYMLDTNICLYVINNTPPCVLVRFLANEAAGLGVSAISASELYYGAQKSDSARNRLALQRLLAPLTVLPYDHRAALHYGEIRPELESTVNLIGPLDQQIAAYAIALNLTLVTNNTREFARIRLLHATVVKHQIDK